LSIASCGGDSGTEEEIITLTPEQERDAFWDEVRYLVGGDAEAYDMLFKIYGKSTSTNSERFSTLMAQTYDPSDTVLLYELNDNYLWIGAFDAGSTKKYFEFTDEAIPKADFDAIISTIHQDFINTSKDKNL